MMLKKFILPVCILLLAACGGNEVDEEINDEEDDIIVEETSEENESPAEEGPGWEGSGAEAESAEADIETVEEEEIDVAAESSEKVAFELVKEDTFTNDTGHAVWEKYQEVTEEYELKDVYDPEGSGTSMDEVEEMMAEAEVEPESFDLDDGRTLMIYHFPDEALAHEDGEPFIMADVSFVFDEEDHLIHSSVAPGFYELELSGTPNAEDLADITSLNDLAEDHDPQVFGVGEMLINEATITQVLIPVDADSNTLGLYIYALGDTIVYSNGDLFFTVSTDFPTYSYLHFQELVHAYGGM